MALNVQFLLLLFITLNILRIERNNTICTMDDVRMRFYNTDPHKLRIISFREVAGEYCTPKGTHILFHKPDIDSRQYCHIRFEALKYRHGLRLHQLCIRLFFGLKTERTTAEAEGEVMAMLN